MDKLQFMNPKNWNFCRMEANAASIHRYLDPIYGKLAVNSLLRGERSVGPEYLAFVAVASTIRDVTSLVPLDRDEIRACADYMFQNRHWWPDGDYDLSEPPLNAKTLGLNMDGLMAVFSEYLTRYLAPSEWAEAAG